MPARRAAGAGAVRRLGEPVPRPRRAVADHAGRKEAAHNSNAKCCRRSSPDAALVCGEGRAGHARRARRLRRVGAERAHVADRAGAASRAQAAMRRPISSRCRWCGRTAARSSCARSRRSPSPRSGSRPRSACMADAFGDDEFCRALVAAIGAGSELETAQGKLRFIPTGAFDRLAGPAHRPAAGRAARARKAATRWSNSATSCSSRPIAGCRPASIPRSRSDAISPMSPRFANSVPVAGTLEHTRRRRPRDDARAAAGLRREPGRRLDRHAQLPRALPGATAGHDGSARCRPQRPTAAARRRRQACTAATWRSCARSACAPASCTRRLRARAAIRRSSRCRSLPADVAAWVKRAHADASATLDRLERRMGALPEIARADAARVLAERKTILALHRQACATLAAAADARASTATTIWGRCWSCRTTS